MATVFERVKKVAMKQLRLQENEVFQDSSFAADLGADSLDQVEMMISLEEEFSTPEKKVSIPDEESEKMLTVQDAVDYLHSIGISDIQAPPKPVEKTGFPRINLPRASMPKPGFGRLGQTERQGQPRQGGQGQQQRGGEQRGGERRDNRPRRDNRQHSNQPRPNFNQRPPQRPAPPPPTQPPTQQPPAPPRQPPEASQSDNAAG